MTSQIDLIKRGLQEVLGQEHLNKVLGERPLKVYWGTAPTGRIHLGYFIPLLKICELLKAGCLVTILIADLHAMLDNLKSTSDLIGYRSEYYIKLISEILLELGADLTKLKFVKGTSFQLKEEYTLAMYKANTMLSVNDAKHCGADVVKQTTNPIVSGLLYPTLQALDEVFLDVDAQLGGIDQRKIFVHGRELLPKLGYKREYTIHLMNKMIPSISKTKSTDSKMSASDTTKIDLLDDFKTIRKKINSAYCLEGDLDGNGLMVCVEQLLFPILDLFDKKLSINRDEKYGGNIEYSNYKDLEESFLSKKLHPSDLKKAVGDFIIELIGPIQTSFLKNNLELVHLAYPNG